MEQQTSPEYNILKTIFTTHGAEEYTERIDRFLAEIYTIERKSILSVLDETLPENISKDIKDYLSATKITLTHQEEVRSALTALQQMIRKARVLSLTMAFMPTKKMTEKMCGSIKENFGDDVIVELNANPDLIAGAIIVFEGKYIDQSVRKKLEILFEAKKDEVKKFLQ